MRSAKKFITVLALLALCLTLMAVSAFAADTTRYYCKAPDSWTECYVYFWSSSDFNMTTWPGEAMTQGEDGIWYYDVPDAASMVIFNKNGSPQTADLVKPTDGNNLYIYEEDTWTVACVHNFVDHTCTLCGLCDHSYEAVTVAPTCTTAGKTTYTCSYCGDSYTETVAATHSYEAVTVAPACTAAGKTTYTCTYCGDSYTETVAASGHSLVDGTCSVCGTVVTASGTCGNSLYWALDDGGTLTVYGKGSMYGYSTDSVSPWYLKRTSITNVVVEDGVTSIGAYAFYSCLKMETVSIAGTVKSIGSHAFDSCTALTGVTIPEGVTSIADCAFYGCTGLTSVTIPAGVTSIGVGAFYGCTGLTSAVIPKGVTSIRTSAFYGCTSLTSVTIPEGVTSIGSCAFRGCTDLASVTVPEGVTTISEGLFIDCTGLTSVVIPVSVTSIGRSAFSGCTGLTSVVIPVSVTSIGSSAFYGCTGLTSVTISEGVTSIGDYAFYHCTSLTSVTIPEGVTSIGDTAFRGCTGLTSVVIPEGVTSIGDYAFYDCTSLTDVYYLGSEEAWAAISIGTYNTWLTGATIHYNGDGVCPHEYTSVVTAPTCTEKGYTTNTCSLCGNVYTSDETAALGHSYDSVVTAPTCTLSGFTAHTCATCGDSYYDAATPATGHSFGNWSIGAMPTCEADGSILRTCAVCALEDTAVLTALGHSYVDGTCENCGEASPVTLPTIQPLGPGLSFKDEIYYNIYFGVTNPDDVEIAEMGVMTWTSAIDGTVETAEHVCPGTEPYYTTYFKARTQAISAKNMGEQLYIKIYLKLADGTYIYSSLLNYSAKDYATNKLASSSDEGLKALCVALMNYGAAAQEYFGYKTDDLMNADLTDEQKALVSDYSDDIIPALVSAGTKADGLAWSGGYSALAPSVNFGGALGINYTFTPSLTMDGEMKLYVWTESELEANDALTLDNAASVITMTENEDGSWTGSYDGISAQNAGDTVYACGVYYSDGVECRTGVLAYSVAAYCKSFANGTSDFQPMAAASAVYAYYADAYLGTD